MIEIKTKYTLEIYKEFFWFSLFRGKYYRYSKRSFPFVTILMIFLAVYYSLFGSYDVTHLLSICGAVVCILFYIMAAIRPKYYVKRSPSLFQSSIDIVFNDESFHTLQTGDIANGTGITKYEAIHKVYETKSTFYLYLTPFQALLLTKSDFVTGTPEELRGLLQSKLPGNKYILCK